MDVWYLLKYSEYLISFKIIWISDILWIFYIHRLFDIFWDALKIWYHLTDSVFLISSEILWIFDILWDTLYIWYFLEIIRISDIILYSRNIWYLLKKRWILFTMWNSIVMLFYIHGMFDFILDRLTFSYEILRLFDIIGNTLNVWYHLGYF